MSLDSIDTQHWIHQRVGVDPTRSGIELSISLHYIDVPATVAPYKATVLLIHGFPETSAQFRHILNPLSRAGYRVIAPDYRGAGGSSKPREGYTKDVMARDMHVLIRERLGIKEPIHVVGHDVGGMIAHSYATQYTEDTASVVWGECPLPGSTHYDHDKISSTSWHFSFHSVLDLPEALVQGRERIYLTHFYERLGQNPDAFRPKDIDVYTSAYAQPGALRCAFDCYRSYEADKEMNIRRVRQNGKCNVRCLALWGEFSALDETGARNMCEEFYTDVSTAHVCGAGHWVAEEQPEALVEILIDWFTPKARV